MKILFVCSGNACRSPVAEALLKKFKSNVEVDSVGTHPYYKIVRSARKYLKRQKAEQFLKRFPEGLPSIQLNDYDIIITMEPKHKEAIIKKSPECTEKIVIWNIADPYDLSLEDAEQIYNQILLRIIKLADSM